MQASSQLVNISKHKHVKPASFQPKLTCFKSFHVDLVRPQRIKWLQEFAHSDWLGHPLPGSNSTPVNWGSQSVAHIQNTLGGIIWHTTPNCLRQGITITSSYCWVCEIFANKRLKTPAYHPEAYSIMEHWHRTLMTAITSVCSGNNNLTQRLPIILLGLHP